MEIDIQNRTKNRLSQKKLEEVAKKILRHLKVKQSVLSVLLLGDRGIRSINRKYLNHDWTTDVISFELDDPVVLGDVVISLDTAKRVAKRQGHSLFYEVCFYLCHGILHMMGWDDKTPKAREKMLAKQTEILKKIGVTSTSRRS